MFLKYPVALSLFLFCSLGRGAVLEIIPGTQEIEGVKIAGSAIYAKGAQKTILKSVSSGLRIKKVAFIKVKVYVAEWMIAENATWQKSIQEMKPLSPVAMRLTFLREVDAEKIESGFRDGLRANKISLDEPAIKAFLKAVVEGGSLKKGQAMTLLGRAEADGSEILVFESGAAVISEIKGPSGFLKQVYSIWFGETTESTLADLKTMLLGKDQPKDQPKI